MKRQITKPEFQALKIRREYLDGLWGVALALSFFFFIWIAIMITFYILVR